MIVSTDPATGTELARYTTQSAEEVDGILDAAASAQAAWSKVVVFGVIWRKN